MTEEIEEQSEDYELDCIADVYRDDVCTIPYAYSAQKLEQAYLDGAKRGYDSALKELVERVEKDQSERQVQTINVLELKVIIKEMGVDL